MPRQHIRIQRQRVQQIRDQRLGAADPTRETPILDGHDAFLPRERLADDPADEATRRRRGFPGADTDRGKAQRKPVDEPSSGVVVDQDLADELLRAVGALRVGEDRLVDDGGEGRTIDGLARGVDDAEAGFHAADRLEEGACRVDVDAHAEVEVRFAAGGHDAMEDVGGVEGGVNHTGGVGGEVAFDGLGVLGVFRAGGDGDVDDVAEDQGVGRVFEEFSGHELAEEAAGAGDEDFHVGCVMGLRGRCGGFAGDGSVLEAL